MAGPLSYSGQAAARGRHPAADCFFYRKFDQPGIYARSLVVDASKNAEIRLVNGYMEAFSGLAVVDDGFYYVGLRRAVILGPFASTHSR